MSAVPSLPDRVSGEESSASSKHVVSVVSPAVARAVVAELLLRPDSLSAPLRTALAMTEGGDKAIAAALERMTVWVDLSTLVVRGLHAEEKQRRKASLTYCVLRQAHFDLLHQLFKVSRYEVQQLRQELDVGVETRPKIIPSSAIDEIHSVWLRLCQEFKQCEADRWISLAEQFPQYGLNSLYQVVVKDARHGND